MSTCGDSIAVEVVIPAYNAVRTIRATLNSVQNQTVAVEKVSVVDDGSSDATVDVVKSFPGIVCYRNGQNQGCCGNWNRCLRYSTGDFVAVLHADDVLDPCWHERCIGAFQKLREPRRGFVLLGAVRFVEPDRPVEGLSFAESTVSYAPGELIRVFWERECYGVPSSACAVYGRGILEEYGLFPVEEYPNMADVPYHWRLLLGCSSVYVPEVSVYVRTGGSSQVTARKQGELAEGAWRSFLEVRSLLAESLGCGLGQITAEYLFPYWLQGHLRRNSPGERKSEMAVAADEAVMRIGLTGICSLAYRHGKERVRRWGWLWRNRRQLMLKLASLAPSASSVQQGGVER